MSEFILFGAEYSVYARIPRLVLEEAGADYRFETFDVFDKDDLPADYLDRHPFGKIPALEHDGFRLFETDAIASYILDITETELIPDDVKARARMRQIMRVVDNYAYPVLVWRIYVDEHMYDKPLDHEDRGMAARIVATIDDLMTEPYLTGDAFNLADCWLVPVVDYLMFTETGQALLKDHPRIADWWSRVETRPSVAATAFVDEREG